MSLADLFHRCLRPAPGRRRRVLPERRKIVFEPLENRLLLSADLQILPVLELDPNTLPNEPALVEEISSPAARAPEVLAPEMVPPFIEEAVTRLAPLGLSGDQLEAVRALKVEIADLSGPALARVGADTLWIDQDATIYVGALDTGQSVVHEASAGRRVYAFVIDGAVGLNGGDLAAGDQARISGPDRLDLSASRPSELLLIDLP
jgi:hypothetical protein